MCTLMVIGFFQGWPWAGGVCASLSLCLPVLQQLGSGLKLELQQPVVVNMHP